MMTTWCAELASKAYIDTITSLGPSGLAPITSDCAESNVAELLSAMAAGPKAQLIVEAWASGGDAAISTGLAIASRHSRGRHVCVVPDDRSREEYLEAAGRAGLAPEVLVGEAGRAMAGLPGVDFLVVDCRRWDFQKVLRCGRFGPRGAILVCLNASPKHVAGFGWRDVLGGGTRVVRSAYLPVGGGLEIVQVAVGPYNKGRWIKHVDSRTGEEHMFRI